MKLNIIKLHPTSSIVFAAGVEGERFSPTYHADTLWGNLIWAYREVWGQGELVALLNAYQGNRPPFTISSGFPFAGEVLFVPTPATASFQSPTPYHFVGIGEQPGRPVPWAGNERPKFISLRLLETVCAGNTFSGVSVKPSLRTTADEARGISDEVYTLRTRTRLTRGTGNTGHNWQTAELSFALGAGLYFFVSFASDEWQEKLKAALRYLSENRAIGADGKSGYGKVSFSGIETIEFSAPAEPNGFLSLSLASPEAANLDAFQPKGEQITRQGWIYGQSGNLQKRPAQLWTEGTFFAGQPQRLKYQGLIDVTPEGFTSHPVYLYGHPFPIPCKKGGC